MVAVFVGDEDVVSFRHGGIVDGSVPQLGHGVDFNLVAIELDADAGVHESVELDLLSAFCLEDVGFVGLCRSLLGAGTCQPKHGQQAGDNLFHSGLVLPCKGTNKRALTQIK